MKNRIIRDRLLEGQHRHNFYTHEIAGEADDDFTRSTDPWCPERGDHWPDRSSVECNASRPHESFTMKSYSSVML